MSRAKPLHLRLFLEGIEVPVISAQVSVSMFAPAAASIQIVPLDEALYFKPRTMVHLFFLEEPEVKLAPSATGQDREVIATKDSAFADTAYKLLFCGEVVGFSFIKQPMSRSVVLQCLDFSSYWDTVYGTMLDWSKQGNALVAKEALYGSTDMFSNLPASDPGHRMAAWIRSSPQTPGLKNVKGLAGGIIHVMERMGGTFSSDAGGGHTLGVNDFYTIADMRCHLMEQVAAEEDDDTAIRLFDANIFWAWLFNALQNAGPQVTLRDMFKLLCQYIYYAVVPNPVAKFDAKGPSELKIPAQPVPMKKMPAFVKGKDQLNQTYVMLDNPGLRARSELAVSMAPAMLDQAAANIGEVPAADKAKSLTLEAASRCRSFKEGPNADSDYAQILALLKEARDELDAVGGKTYKTVPGHSKTVRGAARLKTQIFRPDCYMAVPPICNVVFPEMYSSLNYDRSYASEVTRVEVMTHAPIFQVQNMTQTGANLISDHVVEPSLLRESQQILSKFANRWRILMPHERHTGIIPQIEWTTDMFSNLRGLKEAEKHAKISWQRMTALHHFFKYRIGPRTLNVAGRFNPYMVAGFPALVIQRPFIPEERFLADVEPEKVADYVSQNGLQLGVPPQFVGMVEGLQHTVGQEGGLTSFTMSHCRTHLGIDDEFVGAVIAETKAADTAVERVRYPLVYKDVENDGARLEFLISCTPQVASATSARKTKTARKSRVTYQQASTNGTQTATSDVSSTSRSSELAEASYVQDSPVPWDSTRIAKTPKGGRVAIGSKGLYGGKIAFVEVIAPGDVVQTANGKKAFSGVIVYEDVAVSLAGAEMPVEEIIRPKWLSRVYDNSRIGESVYRPFFGCGSVLDRIVFVGDSAGRPDDSTEVRPDESLSELKTRVSAIAKARTFYGLERAVNLLSYIYGQVRRDSTSDVDEFVTTLVRRPIATKKDLLGAYDLDIQVTGGKVQIPKDQEDKIGFHTLSVHRACSEAGHLTGLTDDPSGTFARMDSGKRETMATMYDVRGDKLKRVLEYRAALDTSRGRAFLG